MKLKLLSILFLLLVSCSLLFPTTPKMDEQIIEINSNDTLSIYLSDYLSELDSLSAFSKRQEIKDGDAKKLGLKGSGWYFVLSPDSSKIAYLYDEDDWKMGYHEIKIWNVLEKKATIICAFSEPDRGSGICNQMAWSKDSKALHIFAESLNPNWVIGLYIDGTPYNWLIYNYADGIIYNAL